MPRRQKVTWSPVEIDWLWKNKTADVNQLCIALSKSPGAVRTKLSELKKSGGKLIVSKGPVKNKRSRIGKRPDCDNKFLRSSYEANFYRWIKYSHTGAKIEYEPETFLFTPFGIKRGTLSYMPDFRITYPNGDVVLVEVKGFLTTQDATKLRRFKKYYPDRFAQLQAMVGSEKSKAYRFFRELGVRTIYIYKDIRDDYRRSGLPGWED